MSRSLNKATLIGNAGSDPDVRTLGTGSKVATLSVATGRTFTDSSGQKQARTEWHRVTLFGKLADVVEQWVKKGDRVYVEGRIEYSESNGTDGQKRYWTSIVAQELIMLSGRS